MKSKIVITIIIISVIAIFSACSTLVYDKLMYPLKFEDLIIENAKENNLEAKLVASVINVESSFREEVVSPKGAVGLMQVKPSTAEWLLETKMDIFYDKNVKVEELLKKYDNANKSYVAFLYDLDDSKSLSLSNQYIITREIAKAKKNIILLNKAGFAENFGDLLAFYGVNYASFALIKNKDEIKTIDYSQDDGSSLNNLISTL